MSARPTLRVFAGSLLTIATTGLLAVAAPSVSANAQTLPAGPCATGTGITVVVDFTDVGGTTETGCALGVAGTGRDALASAGFAAQDSAPGMICAIDSVPDPCPTTFEGSFWSYWHARPGEAWTGYLVGADSSAPVQGEVEGWRYNDGSVGPGNMTAPELSPPLAEETNALEPGHASAPWGDEFLLLGGAFGALVLLGVAAVVLAVRRRRGLGDSSER